MEVNKTLLILSLFMGVTIAYKTLGALGVLKDEPVPDKWDLTERDETTTEDLPEIRKTLSHKATRIANDNGGFHYYCANNAERDTDVPTYINERGRYYRIYSERPIEHICNPSSQGGNVEIRDGERHQICSQGRHLYCYQEEKNVEVVYRSGFYLKKKKFKVPTDCVCGVENPLD